MVILPRRLVMAEVVLERHSIAVVDLVEDTLRLPLVDDRVVPEAERGERGELRRWDGRIDVGGGARVEG